MQNKDHLNVPTPSMGRTSLGLSTPTTFELQLLEVAVKGKTAFENCLNKEHTSYGIDEKVLSLEIWQEIKLWEDVGNHNLLVERARDQVVRMKDHKGLHKRALFIYRDFLNLSLARCQSCESTDTQSSQCRTRESAELTSSIERVSRLSREYASSSARTLDDKLDQMLPIGLPETEDEESSSYVEYCSKAQGEPSGSPCKILSLFDGTSCEEMLIFQKPQETNEGVIPGAQLYQTLSTAEESEGCSSFLSLGRNSHWSQVYPKTTPWANEEDRFSWDASDVKVDLSNEQIPQALGDFPGKDFKYPIQWTIDGITYEARKEYELRSRHDIVTEGVFKKRFKYHTHRSYYGFFFETGVMVYFRNGVFKNAADFRKSTVTIPKGKLNRLVIHDVHVAPRVINWHLKFDNAKDLNTWFNTIVKFSKGLKSEIDVIRQSVGSPVSLISKLI